MLLRNNVKCFIIHRLKNILRIQHKHNNSGNNNNNNNRHKKVANCNKSPNRHYIIEIAKYF